MDKKYESFINTTLPTPYYDYKNLENSGYKLKVRCNKSNPECQEFIGAEGSKGFNIKIIDLDPLVNPDYKNMIDIWVKK